MNQTTWSLSSRPLAALAGGLGLTVALGSSACDVPERSVDTAGIPPGESAGAPPAAAGWGGQAARGAGGAAGTATVRPACARGFVVASSDYQSTSVSLLGLDGTVLSASLISSASEKPGLSAALTGDVVLPTMRAAGDRIRLVDRYPAGVLTWVDLQTASVPAQLSVATGFASNPHDYVEVSPRKAYVPRFEPNHASGSEPFDGGNDVLIVDPSVPEITGRIDMLPAMDGVDSEYLPRPDRAVVAEGRLIVVLGGYTADFLDTVSSRLAVIDTGTDEIVQTLVLDGMHACSGLTLSPRHDELAVACSGSWRGNNVSDIATSGIVRVDLGSELSQIDRYPAEGFGEGPVAFSLSYATDAILAFTTFGRFATGAGEAADDTLIQLDLETGRHEVLLRSADEPFTIGNVSCDSACGVCLVTDAGRSGGVVHRFELSPAGLTERREIQIDDSIGLPPRYLAQF